MGHILVLGGARSGKTSLAERIAMRVERQAAPISPRPRRWTTRCAERVRTHQQQRAKTFATLEEPLNLSAAITRAAKHA